MNNQIITNIEEIFSTDFCNLIGITETKRSDLPDNAFGVPELRKYPLTDEEHVRSAIKFFNYVDSKYEKELADNIKVKIKEYKVKVDIGPTNKLSKYM